MAALKWESSMRRTSRFLRLIVGLTTLCVVTIGGIIYGARKAAGDGYGCLMTLRENRPYKLLDLNTGFVARYRSQPGSQPRLELSNTSPNGRYVAYLRPGSVDRYTLVVEERTGGKPTLEYQNAAKAPLGMNNTAYVFWAPDSSRFAYLWSTGSYESSFILIATPDGSDKQVLQGASSIGGWSRDNVYLAYSTWPQGANGAAYVNIWSPTNIVSHSLQRNRWSNAVWSPSGNRLTYLETQGAGLQFIAWLRIISPDKGLEASFTLPPAATAAEYSTPLWSPDGRYVAMTYMAPNGDRHLDVYGVDRTVIRDVATALVPLLWRLWSDDGQSLIFLTGQPDGATAWVKYAVAERHHQTLLPNITQVVEGNQRFLLAWRHDDTLNVDLIRSGSTERTTVIEGAESVDSVEWSPDWSKLIAVWSRGQGPARWQRLTWAATDGSAHSTLDANFERVWNLTWLDGSTTVAFLADKTNRTSAEMINLQSGARYRLLDRKRTIASIPWSINSSQIAYRWIDADGMEWVNTFGPNGRLLYEFKADRAVFGNVFPSPDAHTAVMKVLTRPSAVGRYGLMLSSSDGQSARIIRDDLIEVYDVFWSPDGQMLAFTGVAPDSGWLLEVMTADGETIRRFAGNIPILERGEPVRWSTCS
jgi:hypothetical protein